MDTELTPRQQAIVNAYGAAWGKLPAVTRDGWAMICEFGPNVSLNWASYGFSEQQVQIKKEGRDVYWRPVGLVGIEDNNGWYRFDKDKPLKNQEVHAMQAGKHYVGKITVFDPKNDYYERTYSHWRPLEEMPLPIY
ncbi:MAG: hypothetical protein J7619_07495 [Dyadobacter sp.]|uniref:hypothetical protein n=1 Tax=Dyadobacter sp. TaxID=1914288 RepID=UPI001B172975|nr:hypothetical protein [Dyadobacter sp.]MBO9612521.1 hypothetical protein [Dyadobacter sp.]